MELTRIFMRKKTLWKVIGKIWQSWIHTDKNYQHIYIYIQGGPTEKLKPNTSSTVYCFTSVNVNPVS